MWLKYNKKPCSGMFALVVYFLDGIFAISEKMCLPTGWYYTIITFLFIMISYTINGNGFKSLKIRKEYNNQEKRIVIYSKNYKKYKR